MKMKPTKQKKTGEKKNGLQWGEKEEKSCVNNVIPCIQMFYTSIGLENK